MDQKQILFMKGCLQPLRYVIRIREIHVCPRSLLFASWKIPLHDQERLHTLVWKRFVLLYFAEDILPSQNVKNCSGIVLIRLHGKLGDSRSVQNTREGWPRFKGIENSKHLSLAFFNSPVLPTANTAFHWENHLEQSAWIVFDSLRCSTIVHLVAHTCCMPRLHCHISKFVTSLFSATHIITPHYGLPKPGVYWRRTYHKFQVWDKGSAPRLSIFFFSKQGYLTKVTVRKIEKFLVFHTLRITNKVCAPQKIKVSRRLETRSLHTSAEFFDVAQLTIQNVGLTLNPLEHATTLYSELPEQIIEEEYGAQRARTWNMASMCRKYLPRTFMKYV